MRSKEFQIRVGTKKTKSVGVKVHQGGISLSGRINFHGRGCTNSVSLWFGGRRFRVTDLKEPINYHNGYTFEVTYNLALV